MARDEPKQHHDLIRGMVEGDQDDWTRYYERWFPRICEYLRKSFWHLRDPEDIAQETLLWVFNAPAERCDPAKAYRYAKHRAIDRYRRHKPECSLEYVSDDGSSTVRDLADPKAGNEDQIMQTLIFGDCFNQLPQEKQELLHLRNEGFTAAEIEEITGIPQGTVGRMVSDAKDQLRLSLLNAERIKRSYFRREQVQISAAAAGQGERP